MCALTTCRFVEPFINAADCQPNGPKFDVKHKDRLLQAAKRAEKMLTQSRKDRCEALNMKPVVLMKPLSDEQLSLVPRVSVTDDSTTDVEPESDKTGEAPTEADVNGSLSLTSVAKAKKPKTPKSVARKKISGKSGDVNDTRKRDATECVEEPQNATGSKQQDDLDSMPPSKMQKFDSAESQAVVGESVLDVASNGTDSAIVSQEVMSNLQPRGAIRQRGGRVSRRHYANVGNRVVPAEHFVCGGVPVLRGRGRGRPGGSVGFTNVHRNEHYGRPTSDGALACGIPQSGMPVRGRGRTHVVGSHISSVCQQPHVDGASVGNSQVLEPASDTESDKTVEAPAEADVNGSLTSVAKAKKPKTRKSVARKKISGKSGDVNDTGKRDATECVEEPQNATGSKQQDDLDNMPPGKMQQFDRAESQAVVGETVLDVASNGTDNAIVSQEVMSNLQLRGAIRQPGGRVSRRHYANVGNRVVPAEHFVCGGVAVLRGRGRGRPGGSVGFTNVHRNEHYGRPTSDGALACGIPQSGMPVRGRGRTRVVGSHISSMCQQPHVAGASVGNSQVLKPASGTDCEYHIL